MKNNQQTEFERFCTDYSFYTTEKLQEQYLLQASEKRALHLFHNASTHVVAYKDFLKKHHIDPSSITTMKDFKSLPLVTKENYIDQYDVVDRSWNGSLSSQHMISTSSGTAGSPYFWPRDLVTEIEGAYVHEYFLNSFYSISSKKTLFVNGFAMGNWIAGTFTQASINLLSWKGYPITLMTPGYSLQAVCDVFETMTNFFDQVILCGHTPFLKEIVESLQQKQFNWKKTPVFLVGTGQAISERWREYMIQVINSSSSSHAFLNLYGSADAALMGFETPYSIAVRSTIASKKEMIQQLFHEERLPSLYNYDPRFTFFEAVNNELVITKYSGCPLIRYNIHDQGGVLLASEMDKHIRSLGVLHDGKASGLPFVFLFGREKFMVKLYGANIYSEHIQHAFSHPRLLSHITGRYLVNIEEDSNHNPVLMCRIELKKDSKHNPAILELVQDIFVTEIQKLNQEYAYIVKELGDKVKPTIIGHTYQDPTYFPPDKIKKTG